MSFDITDATTQELSKFTESKLTSDKIDELGNKIADLFKKYKVQLDSRIYFNNKCIEDGDTLIENIKASDYTDFLTKIFERFRVISENF